MLSSAQGPDGLALRVRRIESVLLYVPLLSGLGALVGAVVLPLWTTESTNSNHTAWLLTAPFDLLSRGPGSFGRAALNQLYGAGLLVVLLAVAVVLAFLIAALSASVPNWLGMLGRIAAAALLLGSAITLFILLDDAARSDSFHLAPAAYLLPIGAFFAAVVAFALRWLWSRESGSRG